MSENFRDRLSFLLKSRKVSQRKLAIAINKDPSAISRYLSGKYLPMADVVMDIANFFNVSVDYLLGKTDDPSTSKDRQILNKLLTDSDTKMSDESKEILKRGILQVAVPLPYIERLDPRKDIREQIQASEKIIIVPKEVTADFATPAPDDMLETEYLKTDILLCRLYNHNKLPKKGVGIFFRNSEVLQRTEGKTEFETGIAYDVLLRKFMISENNLMLLSIANAKYGIEDNNIILTLQEIETEYKLVAIVIGMFRMSNKSESIATDKL
ncbi:MAG: helix-turn-helix transcriptional regulator [Candidatus Micrarchaeaceae archaeon]